MMENQQWNWEDPLQSVLKGLAKFLLLALAAGCLGYMLWRACPLKD